MIKKLLLICALSAGLYHTPAIADDPNMTMAQKNKIKEQFDALYKMVKSGHYVIREGEIEFGKLANTGNSAALEVYQFDLNENEERMERDIKNKRTYNSLIEEMPSQVTAGMLGNQKIISARVGEYKFVLVCPSAQSSEQNASSPSSPPMSEDEKAEEAIRLIRSLGNFGRPTNLNKAKMDILSKLFDLNVTRNESRIQFTLLAHKVSYISNKEAKKLFDKYFRGYIFVTGEYVNGVETLIVYLGLNFGKEESELKITVW
jgi:hypothetical protein